MRAGRVELGNTRVSSSHLAVSSFSQLLSNFTTPFNTENFRQILVTTLSNQLKLGTKGIIDVDFSRSATQYQPTGITADSTLQHKSSLSRIFSSENILANSAISLKYSDEIISKGLSYQVSFDKVANGYANPGNSFLSNGGSTEIGLGMKKTFLKNKAHVSVRVNERGYKYDLTGNNRWRSSFIVLDARWKMKMGHYLMLRYQPVRMIRIEASSKQIATSLERLSFDASLSKRVNKIIYRNVLTLTYQKSSYAFAQGNSRNTSLMINSYQNISIGSNLIYVNTNYSKANNQTGFLYLNSSFLSEAGYTFMLLKKISASSGLVYNSIAAWYKQLGIRQTLSGQLNDKFNINIYVDLRKNLSVSRPLWNDPVRADIALHYYFGK